MTQESYNEIPYPSFSHRETHPIHLATLATLLGMEPAPVERCRVLELGCAGGGNLMPMALELPHSHFIGIDYAERQIEEGQQVLAALGIQNVSLQHMSLMDIGPDFGEFDYIIAHGVYSWVPEDVRAKLLEVCRQNLAPNGVAFVSYNTYPGWHMLGMIREMMLYHTEEIADPPQRVIEGLDLISFLAESAPPNQEGYASFLQAYVAMRKKQKGEEQDDVYSFLLHDDLSEVNTPFYFHEFAGRIAAQGLQYLADGDFPSMMPSKFSPEVVQRLGQMARSPIEFEQYMDFLNNRSFRKTLLCHQEIALSRRIQPTPELLSA
ncbi:MAG: methyltransferase regulatory domain-containing protein, partial [Ardenticatenales bacterium]|nr:methyltransferase regulatory domain-containing protein [Ardenticatenales bacterium]